LLLATAIGLLGTVLALHCQNVLFRPKLELTLANLVDPPTQKNEPARYLLKLSIKNSGLGVAHSVQIPISHAAFGEVPSVFIEPGLAATTSREGSITRVVIPTLAPSRAAIVTLFGQLDPALSAAYAAHEGEHQGPQYPGIVVLGDVGSDEGKASKRSNWIDLDRFIELESASAFPVWKFMALASADSTGTRIEPASVIVQDESTPDLWQQFDWTRSLPGGLMMVSTAFDKDGRRLDVVGASVALAGLVLRRGRNEVVWYYDLRCRVDSTVHSRVGLNVSFGGPDSAKWIRVGGGVWKRRTVFLFKEH